jgi:hypothetical protein
MRGAEFIERYRSYAARCVKISRNIPNPAGKLVLLEMAQAWLKLAEDAAEDAETPLLHEPALPDMPERGSP